MCLLIYTWAVKLSLAQNYLTKRHQHEVLEHFFPFKIL